MQIDIITSEKSFSINSTEFQKGSLNFQFLNGIMRINRYNGIFGTVEEITCDGEIFDTLEDVRDWVRENLFYKGGGSGGGAVESVTGNLVSGTSANPKVNLTGTIKDTVTFNESGNPVVKPIGVEQLTDIGGFPSFANGVLTATAMNPTEKTGLLSFAEFSTTTPKAGTFPTYLTGGILPTNTGTSDNHAVNLGQIGTFGDFTIYKFGNSFTSVPRKGLGLVGKTATSAHNVFQDAIDKLSASVFGGGSIVFYDTQNLDNELVIEGTSSTSPPSNSISIFGNGLSSKLIQNTAGKNGIVVKNKASINFQNFEVYSGVNALSCIYLSEQGDSEISVFGSTIDQLKLESNSVNAPAFKAVNYFDLNVPRLYAANDGHHGIQLINNSQDTNYGNSHFGLIRASGKTLDSFAGLQIESKLVDYKFMNLNTFGNVNIIAGDRGISIEGGCYNTFTHVDTEYMKNPIYIGGSENNQSIGNVILNGYLLINEAGGAGLATNNWAVGNTVKASLDSYDTEAIPVNESEAYGTPNEFNISLSSTLDATKCVWGSSQTLVTIKDSNSSSSMVKLGVIEVGSNIQLGLYHVGDNKILRTTGGVARTITVLNDTVLNLPIGTVANIISPSAKATFVASSGVNIISDGGLKSVDSNCSGKLIKIGNNEWQLSGKLVA